LGSHRKGKTIDTLVSKAVEGTRANLKNVTFGRTVAVDDGLVES
jgi:hypothetical protein